MKNIDKPLQKVFKAIEKRKKLVLIGFIILILAVAYSSYVKNIIIMAFFIVIAAVSKIYHKFFKSTLSLDLVLFTTLVSVFTMGVLPAFVVAYLGRIGGDYLSGRLKHTTLISLFCLTLIILIANLFVDLPVMFSLIVILIIYNIISAVLYYFIGSSFQKILVYLISNLSINLFLIFTFGNMI